MQLEIGAVTDVGRQRQRNEDRYAAYQPEDAEGSELLGLALVADGMGGERGGALASQRTADRIVEWLSSGDYHTWPEYTENQDLGEVLRRATRDVSNEVYQIGEVDENVRGLGTTVVLAAFSHDRLWIAHVGDSRCYRVRDGSIRRLTADHSWVEEQVAAGILTPEEARSHPQRNVLTRSIGDSETPEADVRAEPVRDRDRFILCSDGLTGGVSDLEILDIVRRHSTSKEVAQALVDLANERGGSDNITVVVVGCDDAEQAAARGRVSEPEDTEPMERPQIQLPRPSSVGPNWFLLAGAIVLTLLLTFLGVRTYAARCFERSVVYAEDGQVLQARQEMLNILEIVLGRENSEQVLNWIYREPTAEEPTAEEAAVEEDAVEEDDERPAVQEGSDG